MTEEQVKTILEWIKARKKDQSIGVQDSIELVIIRKEDKQEQPEKEEKEDVQKDNS